MSFRLSQFWTDMCGIQVSGVRPHCQHTTYRVPGSPALADYSQSQTVNDFLRSCHSMRHTAEPPAMPPLPPDVGSSMEKLLLDQICQLCQVLVPDAIYSSELSSGGTAQLYFEGSTFARSRHLAGTCDIGSEATKQ